RQRIVDSVPQSASVDGSTARVGIGGRESKRAGAELRQTKRVRSTVRIGNRSVIGEVTADGIGGIKTDAGAVLKPASRGSQSKQCGYIRRGKFARSAHVQGKRSTNDDVVGRPVC